MVVYFFASWCAPCYPTLKNLQNVLSKQQVPVAVIAASFDDSDDDLRTIIDNTGFSGAVWRAEDGATPLRARQFANHAGALPYMIVIDKKGYLAERSYTISSQEQWSAILTEGRPVSDAEKI